MIKTILFTVILFCFLNKVQGQIEISPLLDTTPVNGISYASAIIAEGHQFTYIKAIEACRNLVYNGKSDWYLPTWEEFVLFMPSAGSQTAWALTNASVMPSCVDNTSISAALGGGSGANGCLARIINSASNITRPIALRMSNTNNYGLYGMGLIWRWYYDAGSRAELKSSAPLRFYGNDMRYYVYCVR